MWFVSWILKENEKNDFDVEANWNERAREREGREDKLKLKLSRWKYSYISSLGLDSFVVSRVSLFSLFASLWLSLSFSHQEFSLLSHLSKPSSFL